LSRARAALWPTLSAHYTRSRSGDKEFPSDRDGWSWGGTLSLPLFGNGLTAAYYAVASAEGGLTAAEESLRAARAEAEADLESAWADYAGAADQVKVQAALLAAARQRNDEADVRYATGLLTYDNWEIIASDRISSERQAVQSALNAVAARAAWEKAVGITLGDQP
jgi:outer membrane protein TolC